MKVSFTSSHIVINDLFARDIYYTIPHYQRPYSWECLGKSERNNQVNVMWEDLNSFFETDKEGEYFFGSMVMIDKGKRTYEVIDGQQRLTTLVILFVAIKCFLKKVEIGKLNTVKNEDKDIKSYLSSATEAIDDLLFNKARIGLNIEKKVRIEKNADYDYDTILNEIMNCSDNSSKRLSEKRYEQKIIIDRYFRNRQFLEEQITSKFSNEGVFTLKHFEALQDFVSFLENRVSLIRIDAPDLNIAYRIFEVLNNRGLQLSDKDLFRNFIISEFAYLKEKNPKFSEINPSEKWTVLEHEFSISTDFIRRWVESKNAVQIKTTPYNELYDLYSESEEFEDKPTSPKIEVFYSSIKKDLQYFSYVVGDQTDNLELKNRTNFLLKFGNASYTTNLLLSLFRSLDYKGDYNEQVNNFLITYETFMMYLVLSPARRFSKTPVNEAINHLNENRFEEAKRCFTLDKPQQEEVKKLLDGKHLDNAVAKLFIAKYIWIQETECNDVVEQKLNFDKATLEHIIPQKPEKGTNWKSDFSTKFRDDFTYKLGNMTLLTQSLNSSARNFGFHQKQGIYKKTLLSTTSELAQLETISEDYIKMRQQKIVERILKDVRLIQ